MNGRALIVMNRRALMLRNDAGMPWCDDWTHIAAASRPFVRFHGIDAAWRRRFAPSLRGLREKP